MNDLALARVQHLFQSSDLPLKPLKDENTINQIEFNSNIFLIPEGDDRNFDLIQQENQIIQYEDLLIDNLNLFINIINNKKLLYYENNNNLIDSFKI